MQNDSYFEMYSSVDERSAAYLACGLAAESGEPVALSCTGATASRNYMSGLTEAYYRKLPILAITSHQGREKIGHLIAQNLDRTIIPNDIVTLSVEVPNCINEETEWYADIQINKALLELRRHGGGPVHINLITTYSRNFDVPELPPTHVIRRICPGDTVPEIPEGNVAIFVGSHKKMTLEETEAIERFCETYNAVVFCDHTSGYYGKYKLNYSLVFAQQVLISKNTKFDTLIHIGEVSGDYFSLSIGNLATQVWRVSEDGEIRDTFRKLSHVFETKELDFFEAYAAQKTREHAKFQIYQNEYEYLLTLIPELPFSNLWIAKNFAPMLPKNSVIHFGILNSLRAWNMFELPSGITSYSNVGGFGIDGCVSSLIGAALASPDKLFFGIVGDLAFFYDLNSLGNRHLPSNLRLILINNGKGQEFRNSSHTAFAFGDKADAYIAAGGHFGNKSEHLVRHYAQNLGMTYITANNKETALNNAPAFFNENRKLKPVLFEIFTNSADETQALDMVQHLISEEDLEKYRRSVNYARIMEHLSFGKKRKHYIEKKLRAENILKKSR